MRQIVKEAAEMYALQCISSPQLMEVCESIQEILESLEYAEEYGAQYDLYIAVHHKREKRREDDMREDWAEMRRKTIQKYSDYRRRLNEEFYVQYLDFVQDRTNNDILKEERLRRHFWCYARAAELNLTRDSIKRIADEARGRFMLFDTVHEFFKAYHLNDLEKEYFWRCYKYPESC